MRLKEVRNILYAHKKFLVSVNRAEEDGVLLTQFSELPIKKGELFAVDRLGNTFPLADKYFKDNYVPVERVNQKRTKQLSPFEEQYYKTAYEEMAKLNSEEDSTYIEGTKEKLQSNEVLNLINKIY